MSFVTLMNEHGIAQPHVVEACLNHVTGSQGRVASVYNKYHYLPEKTAALERWSNHLIGLVENRAAKIVPMKRKARAAK